MDNPNIVQNTEHDGLQKPSEMANWKKCQTPDLEKMKIVANHDEQRKVSQVEESENEATGKESRQVTRSIDANWQRVRKQLEIQLGKDVFDSWFGRLKLHSCDGGVINLTVPTAFLKTWIHSKYRENLLTLWQEADSSVLRVDISIRKPI